MPAKPPSDVTLLRRELAEVKKELAKLQKALAKLEQPGKLQATKATVESLEILDAEGNKLAGLDKDGTLFCQKILVGGSPKAPGVLIEGGEHRRITAGNLHLKPADSKHAVAELSADGGFGQVLLNSLNSKQRLWLQANASPLLAANDLTGAITVNIACNGELGGRLQLSGGKKGSGASAIVGISQHTQAGAVVLQDANGGINGSLP